MDRNNFFPILSSIWILIAGILSFGVFYIFQTPKYMAYFVVFYSFIWPLNGLMMVYGSVQHSNKEVGAGISFISKMAFLGLALLSMSVFFTNTNSIIYSNYVYLFDDLIFILGFSIFLCCILVVALITLPKMLSIVSFSSVITFIYSYWKIAGEIYYPLDESNFFEMLFCSSLSMIELLYIILFYQIILQYLGPVSNRLTRIINLISIINMLWILAAHLRFDIDSADFIISVWVHGSYIKAMLVFVITYSAITQILRARGAGTTIILYPVILLVTGFVVDLILSDKSAIPEFYYRNSLLGIVLTIMFLLYSLLEKNGKFSNAKNWYIRLCSLGGILHINSNFEFLESISVYIKCLSILLITIGILLFLAISFNNILQIYKNQEVK